MSLIKNEKNDHANNSMLATVGPEQCPYRAVSIRPKQALEVYLLSETEKKNNELLLKIQQ